ncbi:ExeM/NucH family extracellular endonuclease [Nocardioides stalactiti]|uniref:ExeM/NucH family extracellular endonuclease n=1 Tax=Nocardioides stalactiti TaxID=2755356 RepID=UPI001603ABAB|nr:ExeM/NucH family extracellular endonuclease [Nocardioides stalactiti]
MRSSKNLLAAALGLGLTSSGLALGVSPGPVHAVGAVFISELHYDDLTANDAGGVGEFVEVTAPAGTDLTGWKLQLVNGANNTVYRTENLSGTVADQADGNGTWVVTFPTVSGGILQNGSPDGVALVNAGGGVVEFVSYEGSITATLGTPGVSTTSVDTGSAVETNATAGDQSIQRQPDGSWAGPVLHTKGLPNGASGGGGGDPVEVDEIADVQGSGAATPVLNQTVTVSGVVTATFPTGGFNGFYLQTPGPDTTPGRSDGIFVFGGSFDESTLALGDSVEVTGTAVESSSPTETNATTVTPVADLGDVVPNTVIPGTDCALPGTGCLTGAALEAAREEMEGEAFQPTGDFTVTDVYDGSPYIPGAANNPNFVGEVGLAANSSVPLISPTEIIDAQATAAINARKAYNDAHRVLLDDGSSTTYWNTSNNAAGQDTPFPYFTPDHQVRVGAAVTFDQPVVLDYRFGWKVQPVHQVVEEPTGLVTFEQDRPALPEDVGGDVRLATFNVLNYFTTLGEDLAGCQAYEDRDGNPIAIRPSCDARGAWDVENFLRQEAKIVNAINALDADVVSLEEIENSLQVDGHDRDEALAALVDALNEDAGAGTWDFVASPASASLPENLAEQDVIRQGLIFKPATVETVGGADMLFDVSAFANAREPFAAVFKPLGGDADSEFAVIVNHFKSKGSGTDDGTGQGASNPSRVAQAEALAVYAEDFAAERGVEAVFLTGDFNAYSEEDPMQVLYGEGYENLAPEGEWSYNFDGQVGSLDHVLANPAAAAQVAGVDIWEINSNETVFNQYTRYNYNAAQLYSEAPFSASDHNPEIVGIGEDEPVVVDPTVTGSDVSLAYGRGTTMHVEVAAEGVTPTGSVVLSVGDVVLGGGTLVDGAVDAPVAGKKLAPGTHEVTVSYLGDAAVHPGSTTATLTVTRATPTVVGTRTTVEYGRGTTMAVRVGAVNVVPTGRVVLSSGGVTLGTGTLTDGVTAATILAKKLPVGTHTVTVTYAGDTFVKPATVTTTLVVQKATPTVTGTDKTIRFGTGTTMAVKVKAFNVVPTGRVVLTAGGVTLGAADLVDGAATVNVAGNRLPASATPYEVTIRYAGDGSVRTATGTATLTVNP